MMLWCKIILFLLHTSILTIANPYEPTTPTTTTVSSTTTRLKDLNPPKEQIVSSNENQLLKNRKHKKFTRNPCDPINSLPKFKNKKKFPLNCNRSRRSTTSKLGERFYKIPSEYKEEAKNCSKVYRDSMLCEICVNPKTHVKYEQCSYVAEKPQEDKDVEESSSGNRQISYEDDDDTKTADCRKIEKDGQLCTVCKDKKTNGNYEECEYTYEPRDKLYKFTRSSSFGGATKTTPSPNVETLAKIQQQPNDGCVDVRKDSMICTVCKNKKTGATSEKCSYSYEPNDKLYSYSKSSSFGSPTDNKEKEDDESEPDDKNNEPEPTHHFYNSSKPIVEEEEEDEIEQDDSTFKTNHYTEVRNKNDNNCKRVYRDGMTCYQCVDDDDIKKEECMFVGSSEKPNSRKVQESGSNFKGTRRRKSDKDDPSESYFQWQKKKPRQRYQKRQIEEEPREEEREGEFRHLEVRTMKKEKRDGIEKENNEEEESSSEDDLKSETRMIYDKRFGFYLPKYMVTPSEHEIEFDETVASSSFHSS